VWHSVAVEWAAAPSWLSSLRSGGQELLLLVVWRPQQHLQLQQHQHQHQMSLPLQMQMPPRTIVATMAAARTSGSGRFCEL
jgi:hypothetical protein